MIHIGTSGWHYKHWKNIFYPPELPSTRQLSCYSESFKTVEINNTFYSLPAESTVRNWHATVPEDFVFAVKASRYITHVKKLMEPADALERFFGVIKHLGKKTGPILFQFPPTWSRNEDRLREFLLLLPGKYRYVFEFRHESWFDRAIYSILENAGGVLCLYDRGGQETPLVLTGDSAYVRFHGSEGPYHGNYVPDLLRPWAKRIDAWSGTMKDIWVYFNNDWQGFALENAQELAAMLGIATNADRGIQSRK